MAIQLKEVKRKSLVGIAEDGKEFSLGKREARRFNYYSPENRIRQLKTLQTFLVPGYFLLGEPERIDNKTCVQPYTYYYPRK